MHKKDSTGKAVFDSNPRDLFTETNFRKFEKAWDDPSRVPTAFFRGTATGGGTTIHNNQRLMVAHLAHSWKDDPEKGGEIPFLDAAIVGWNMRDKKISSGPMTFLRSNEFGFTAGKHHFTPIYEQSRYKYLVYVDGHCAACRYGFMMRLGSVILKVIQAKDSEMIFFFWCRDHSRYYILVLLEKMMRNGPGCPTTSCRHHVVLPTTQTLR
jgi:hypothetical protein